LPLLDALKRLRDGGLTVAGVIAAFHRWRVLPLMALRLRLDQMEEGVPLEGFRMSDTSLTVVEVTRRVAYMVATWFTVADLNRVKMRPTLGYISQVSAITLPYSFDFCSPLVSSSVADVVLSLGVGEDGEAF
jgi:hypothetical protein